METGELTYRWPYEPVERDRRAPDVVACKLPREDIRKRVEALRESFHPGILEVEELDNGMVYWFARSNEWLAKVTEFALFESECCDFLDFGIGLCAGGERISLRVSGPGSKEFLAEARRGKVRSVADTH